MRLSHIIIRPVRREPAAPERARRSPAAEGRIRELLSRPLTADGAALVAVLGRPELEASCAELGLAGDGGSPAGFRLQVHGASSPRLSALLLPMGGGASAARRRQARRDAASRIIETAARARHAFEQAVAAEQRLLLLRAAAGATDEIDAAEAGARRAREAVDQALGLTESDPAWRL